MFLCRTANGGGHTGGDNEGRAEARTLLPQEQVGQEVHMVTATRSIPIRRTEAPRAKPDDSQLGFGTVFTDHMFVQEYHEERGWHDARIEPYHALTLDPAATVLHYAQEVFDGLKAFRWQDGSVRLFRPEKHVERLLNSSARMCIPPLDASEVLASFKTLVDLEREWAPHTVGTALYVRPTIIATEPFLGVRPARSYLYYVILSPVGPYFGGGLDPVRILVADNYVRAVEGGVGAAKTGGNYAASLYAGEEARCQGFSQVLWLDGVNRRYLDEVGTMNVMVRIGEEVITPPLTGTILPGITRDSVLTILHDWGVKASERPISIDEVIGAAENGSLIEAWGTGTAAVISPIGELAYKGKRLVVNGGKVGELTQRLYDSLVGIQYGRTPDPYGWTVEV
jgi:branched-chain amino acid aminotransferase